MERGGGFQSIIESHYMEPSQTRKWLSLKPTVTVVDNKKQQKPRQRSSLKSTVMVVDKKKTQQ